MALRIKTDGSALAEMSKGQVVGVGFGLILLGVVLIGGSAVLVNIALKDKNVADKSAQESYGVCRNILQQAGLQVDDPGADKTKISARINGTGTSALRLGEASVASLACPGWRLSQFCMGECKEENPGGVWLELKPG